MSVTPENGEENPSVYFTFGRGKGIWGDPVQARIDLDNLEVDLPQFEGDKPIVIAHIGSVTILAHGQLLSNN